MGLAGKGERFAAQHLKRRGYRIISRNLRSRLGEIDLLAEAPDGRTLVIVEVKSRAITPGSAPSDELPPEVRVNRFKQRKLVALAAHWTRRLGLTRRPIRFDVVGVDLSSASAAPIVRHHVGAFESHV